jgi:heavy metal sensor kinase
MTLRIRFALWVAGLLLVVLVAFGGLVYVSLAHDLYTSLDDALQLSASQALAAVNSENGQINFADSIPESSPATQDLRERGVTIRIFDVQGRAVASFGPYATLPLQPEALAAASQQRAIFSTMTFPNDDDALRFYTTPIIEGDQYVGILQVGQSLGTVQDTLARLRIIFLVSIPFLTAVAALGGYGLAARALAPIDAITRTARHISSEDLSARLDLPPTNDEVGRLSATFDEMLTRLDEAFRRERRFVADASHELRTPLAAMQAILSVMREERRTPEEYEQTLTDLTEETDRLRTLVENLMLLARSDQQRTPVREPVNLSALLDSVTEGLRPLAEGKGLTLKSAIDEDLTLLGDEDALIRVFVNLLDNAMKYTGHGAITVAARRDGPSVQVSISDTGIGIAAEHLPHVFERFYRVDAARSGQGAGLGLAIAQDLVRAHDGSIDVQSTLGEGTTFTVRLPAIE